MIQKIHVINHLGEKLTMELSHPEKSNFAIFNMDGLGPGKAQITTTDLVSDDGGVFKNARLLPRNITFNIRYFAWEGKSIEEIRLDSYKRFPIKRPITIIFETDIREVFTEGYVESNEPVIFTKESFTTISILCPNPFIRGKTQTLVISKIIPMFEFPFSNESMKPEIIISELVSNIEGMLYYDGDIEIGMVIDIEARDIVEDLIIYNLTGNEQLIINTSKLKEMTGTDILPGDRIQISTNKGEKYIRLLRFGVWTNIINILERRSPWFTLVKGENLFAFRARIGEANVKMSITYNPLYEGV